MALLDCAINEKYCSVGGGRGICPLFSSPPRGFDSSRIPTPGNLPSKAKKMLMPGGQPGKGGGAGGRWNWWCIMHRNVKYKNVQQSFNPGLQANRPFRSIRKSGTGPPLVSFMTVTPYTYLKIASANQRPRFWAVKIKMAVIWSLV